MMMGLALGVAVGLLLSPLWRLGVWLWQDARDSPLPLSREQRTAWATKLREGGRVDETVASRRTR